MDEIIITHRSGRRVRREFTPRPNWKTEDQIVSLIIEEGMFTRGTIAEVYSLEHEAPLTIIVNAELH